MKHLFLGTEEQVAQAVRSERETRGWSQSHLAARARVEAEFVAGMEAGHQQAELGKVFSVLTALDIHATALPEPPPPQPPTAADIDAMLRSHD